MFSKIFKGKKDTQNAEQTAANAPTNLIAQVKKTDSAQPTNLAKRPISKRSNLAIQNLVNFNKCCSAIWKCVVSSDSPVQNFPPLLPPQTQEFLGRKTLVLDLDETLVHSTFDPVSEPDLTLPVKVRDATYYINVLVRPGLEEFLSKACDLFEVVIFTASLPEYAKPLMKMLDPQRRIKSLLFRDSCSAYKGYVVKDMARMGRSMKDIIIVDNSATSFLLQPENAYHIKNFFDDKSDTELETLMHFLEFATRFDDVRPIPDKRSLFERKHNGGHKMFTAEHFDHPLNSSNPNQQQASSAKIPQPISYIDTEPDLHRKRREREFEVLKMVRIFAMKKKEQKLLETDSSAVENNAMDRSTSSNSSGNNVDKENKVSQLEKARLGLNDKQEVSTPKESDRLMENRGGEEADNTDKEDASRQNQKISAKVFKFGDVSKDSYTVLEPENEGADYESDRDGCFLNKGAIIEAGTLENALKMNSPKVYALSKFSQGEVKA